MMKIKAKIGDPVGLHLRAASRIVKVAKEFESEIQIAYDGVKTNAKSILGLASLVARYQEEVELTASGSDEAEAIRRLQHLIEVELGSDG